MQDPQGDLTVADTIRAPGRYKAFLPELRAGSNECGLCENTQGFPGGMAFGLGLGGEMEALTDGDMQAEGDRHPRSREQWLVVQRSSTSNVWCFPKANKGF